MEHDRDLERLSSHGLRLSKQIATRALESLRHKFCGEVQKSLTPREAYRILQEIRVISDGGTEQFNWQELCPKPWESPER